MRSPVLQYLPTGSTARFIKSHSLTACANRTSKDSPLLNGYEYLLEGWEDMRERLEKLSIWFDTYPTGGNDSPIPDNYFSPFYGIMTHFPHLRSAEIPIVLLPGWSEELGEAIQSSLSATLEELILHVDCHKYHGYGYTEWEIVGHIKTFVHHSKSTTPSLKRIVLRLDRMLHFNELKSSDLERWRTIKMCQEQGVALEIIRKTNTHASARPVEEVPWTQLDSNGTYFW